MKHLILHATVILVVAFAGCARNCYVIEIMPDGESFQRKLTCWHEGGEGPDNIAALPEAELKRLEKLYGGRETPDNAKKHVFAGRFTAHTPSDVGGAGFYVHFSTPLGTLSAYVERFRGNDDLEAELAKRRAAADQVADLVLGWLASELGDDPNFDQLRQFLDSDLRQDLKNLTLYLWINEEISDGNRKSEGEFLVRAGQYLCERGYVTPNDLPRLVQAFWGSDAAPALRHLQRILARKMGVPDNQSIPESLAFLADPQRTQKSWEKYLMTTDRYQELLKQWKEAKKTDPDAEKPKPEEVVGDLLADGFIHFGLGRCDKLEVKLSCPQQPLSTNGDWSAENQQVTWSGVRLPENESLPTMCFAVWSCADCAFQQEHFGKMLLDGEKLGEYALWYCGLTPQQTDQWDRFVADCKPGDRLKAAIEAFRFRGDPQPDPDQPEDRPPSLADTPRQLMLERLEEQQRNK